jgi:hypothetical protein
MTLFDLIVHTNNYMNDLTTRHKATGLEENNTFDIIIALGKEVQFLYSLVILT